jgi:hypothetical protein
LHKNVAALVATAEACTQGTQRVRKALRFGLPIVSPAWLEACVARGGFVPPAPFAQAVGSQVRLKATAEAEAKATRASAKAAAGKASSSNREACDEVSSEPATATRGTAWEAASVQQGWGSSAAAAWASSVCATVDFGCVCSCHDADCEPFLGQEAASCEWCEAAHPGACAADQAGPQASSMASVLATDSAVAAPGDEEEENGSAEGTDGKSCQACGARQTKGAFSGTMWKRSTQRRCTGCVAAGRGCPRPGSSEAAIAAETRKGSGVTGRKRSSEESVEGDLDLACLNNVIHCSERKQKS